MKFNKLVVVSALFAFLLSVGNVEAERSSRIKHIVVLMMENRSFDHLLGWLKQDKNPAIDGLTGRETQPRDPNDPSKGSLPVTRNGYDVSPSDPKHNFDDIATQMNHNQMNGFVYSSVSTDISEDNPVSMFDHTTAPVINTLATEFAVFDRWFCSIPTSTDPNRAFALSGTSKGVITNFNGTLWEQQSYFDYLLQHNRSVAGYFQTDLWVFGYFQDMRKPEVAATIEELDSNLYKDIAAGNLPDFTWLQPRSVTVDEEILPTWQHPDASIAEGERLIKSVYEALRASPIWNETLFLITYDEHGGFMDHVVPPHRGVPAPDEAIASNGFSFDQLGVRIPTIAISPWIQRGTLVHEALPGERPTPFSAFESTSIMATANRLLGLEEDVAPPLGKRMAWANTFTGLTEDTGLTAPRSDCPMTLPDPPKRDSLQFSHALQSLKPLNEHLLDQLLMLCTSLYPEEHRRGVCPGRPELLQNQGQASQFIVTHMPKMCEKYSFAC